MTTTETVEVTDEDRKAAANLLGYKDYGDATDYRLTGEQDRQVASAVEAFARHRIRQRERDAQIAEGQVFNGRDAESQANDRAVERIAQAIRTQEQDQ